MCNFYSVLINPETREVITANLQSISKVLCQTDLLLNSHTQIAWSNGITAENECRYVRVEIPINYPDNKLDIEHNTFGPQLMNLDIKEIIDEHLKNLDLKKLRLIHEQIEYG